MNDMKSLPASRTAYAYCEVTREFLGTIEAPLSPGTGTYPLPPNAVFVSPPADTPLFKRYQLHESKKHWSLVDDYRNVATFSKASAEPVANSLSLAQPIPDDMTHAEPVRVLPSDYRCNRWDEQRSSWTLVPDYSHALLWNKADASIAPRPEPGDELPHDVTMKRPPAADAPVRFDEELDDWVVVEDEEPTPD